MTTAAAPSALAATPPPSAATPPALGPATAASPAPSPSPSPDDAAPAIRWEPYTGEKRDGAELEGRLGRITVPENRARPDGATIEIAFVHYASDAPDPGPPIFFLVGGPGGSGVEWCAEVADDPRMRLLDHGDVIGIDQRGTGLSRPNLADGPAFEYELPLDRAITREDVADAWRDAVARSRDHWTREGVDLGAYDSVQSADDVDAVRAALGYEKIVLWGTSYGSHLGLAVLRRHAEHVARAVLMKVEGPDATFKRPSTTQRVLERAAAYVAADPGLGEALPDLEGTVRALLEQLEREPVVVTVERGPESMSVTLGAFDLRTLIANALADTQNLAGLPAALFMMEQGEWRHTFGFAMRNRFGEVGSAMAVAMDCASGATSERLALIERERADPAHLLGDALSAPIYPETCAACGDVDLGDAYRAAFRCDVPTLFVSGDLDARTPPENVEGLLPGFAHGAHVLVRNTGHDDRELISDEYRALVHGFLRGERVESTTIDLPPIEWRPLPMR